MDNDDRELIVGVAIAVLVMTILSMLIIAVPLVNNDGMFKNNDSIFSKDDAQSSHTTVDESSPATVTETTTTTVTHTR